MFRQMGEYEQAAAGMGFMHAPRPLELPRRRMHAPVPLEPGRMRRRFGVRYGGPPAAHVSYHGQQQTAGVGEYEQAAAGMGFMHAPRPLEPGRMRRRLGVRYGGPPAAHVSYHGQTQTAGMGEYFSGTGGSLVNWAHQEEAEHPGIFGMGEYFAANGLGDVGPLTTEQAYISGGGVVGLALGALFWKKNRMVGALAGAALGAGAGYAATKMGPFTG